MSHDTWKTQWKNKPLFWSFVPLQVYIGSGRDSGQIMKFWPWLKERNNFDYFLLLVFIVTFVCWYENFFCFTFLFFLFLYMWEFLIFSYFLILFQNPRCPQDVAYTYNENSSGNIPKIMLFRDRAISARLLSV